MITTTSIIVCNLSSVIWHLLFSYVIVTVAVIMGCHCRHTSYCNCYCHRYCLYHCHYCCVSTLPIPLVNVIRIVIATELLL